MPANKRCIIGLFLVVAAASIPSVAGVEDNVTPASVAYAKRQIAESVVQLGERIEHCDAVADERPTPEIDESTIRSPGASRAEIIEAIGHLAVRNGFRCERRARQQLAWDLEKLSIAATDADVEVPDIEGISRSLIYPSASEIRSEANYSVLPSSLRTRLEEAVGKKPFDPVQTISGSPLGYSGSE